MHRRAIFTISTVLFLLLNVLSYSATALWDYGFPIALETRAGVQLDFSRSDLTQTQALPQLIEVTQQAKLGLIRVLPDLTGDQAAELYVRLGSAGPGTGDVPHFGFIPTGRVVEADALHGAFPSGRYLVTSESAEGRLLLATWLQQHGVKASWSEGTVASFLSLLGSQPAFLLTLVAASALALSLVLYWLTVRARSRALRVLGGVPTGRIMAEDGGRHFLTTSAAAVMALIVGSAVVLIRDGAVFLPAFATIQVAFSLVLVGVSVAGLFVMSAISWPSETALARRSLPMARLRRATAVLLFTTFAVIAFAVGPVVERLNQAQQFATQQARWHALANEVVLSFAAQPEDEAHVLSALPGMLRSADAQRRLAFSYAWSAEDGAGAGPVDPRYDAVALVNGRWLQLMGVPESQGQRVDRQQLPPAVRDFFESSLPLWLQDEGAAAQEAWWSHVRAIQFDDGEATVAKGGSGQLLFPRRTLILEVPAPAEAFNADFLYSAASTRNVTLTGLDQSASALRSAGLSQWVEARFAAQDGILVAQHAAFTAWLSALSLGALTLAFVVSAFISALISSMLFARTAFLQRLDGRPWATILGPRLAAPLTAGAVVGGVAVVLSASPLAVGSAVVAGGVVVVVFHFATARWAFEKCCQRAL